MADGNVTMSNDDRLDISEIIDLERYPIGELDGSGSRVVGRCRAELAEDGACQLDGFIRPVAAQAVLGEDFAELFRWLRAALLSAAPDGSAW